MADLESGTATACGLTREVTWDPETGESTRQSVSAGTHVDNGIHDSLEDAIAEAEADIERGPRDHGDTSFRG